MYFVNSAHDDHLFYGNTFYGVLQCPMTSLHNMVEFHTVRRLTEERISDIRYQNINDHPVALLILGKV